MSTETGYPFPQGCTVNGEKVNFSVAVPDGKTCELLLYRRGKKTPETVIEMQENGAVGALRFTAVLLREPQNYEYNYRIDGKICPDLRGKAFAGREVWGKKKDVQEHEVRTRIVCGEAVAEKAAEKVIEKAAEKDAEHASGAMAVLWKADRQLRLPMQEVVAYTLHLRGFTKHPSSKVRHRGTFRGLMEKIPYIKELGINQLQCMPVYDFEENLKYTNYWGYGEGYFFAPKASYASNEAVEEMKELVLALHQAGIELVLEMPFTASEARYTMLECLRHWVMEYHIDGFIVNPVLLDPRALAADPVLAYTKILTKQEAFQTAMRRFLKGDEGMIPDVTWWLKHQCAAEGNFNYIANHNGFTLHDVVSYDGKHNELNGENNQDGPDYNYSWNCGAEGPSRKRQITELRRNQVRNAFFLLLLAQGTPCILAGDEFANTQKGNNNVYCQDNPTAWLDWSRLEKEEELHGFVKDLIAFRKKHKLFHPDREMCGMSGKWGIPDISYHGESAWCMPSEVASRQLGVFYHDVEGKEEDCYVAYNMHWLEHSFALPKLPKGWKWYEAASTGEGVLAEARLVEKIKEVSIAERTIKVFTAKQEEV